VIEQNSDGCGRYLNEKLLLRPQSPSNEMEKTRNLKLKSEILNFTLNVNLKPQTLNLNLKLRENGTSLKHRESNLVSKINFMLNPKNFKP
jgi:hypothetical protein